MLNIRHWPKISIITPCFNSETYLEETINSVLEQGYSNLEYIIIDGGSTDNTLNIIRKYESRLAYWISERDTGMYDALQKGFKKTTGEIMSWIGSDDMYHKKSLFTIAEIFSSFQNIKWLVGASTTFDEYGRTVNVFRSRRFLRYDFLCKDYKWLQQESCFWRRTLWEQAGANFDCSLLYAGDFDLWIRFFRSEKLYVTHALIGGFRQRRSNQLSFENMNNYLKEVEYIIRREKKEKLNKKEQKMLNEYNAVKKILHILKKTKIFNIEKIFSKYKKIRFGMPDEIFFDRLKQCYTLS
jgi:glycosyltransferase involved in cell wall biosynthesis